MTKYECHGCWKVYDDEEGMPGRCCDKVLRHKVIEKVKCENCEQEIMTCSNCSGEFIAHEDVMCNKRESGNEHFCEGCLGRVSTVSTGGELK